MDIIDEFIGKIDDTESGWKPLSIWKKIKINITHILLFGILFFILIMVYYAVTLLLPVINTPESLLPIVIAIASFFLTFSFSIKEITKPLEIEERIKVITDWNFDRIKKRENKEKWLLLKALIRLKTLQEGFKLSEVRENNPSLFIKENLIDMLYGLPPVSVKTMENEIKKKEREGNENKKPDIKSQIAEYKVLNDQVLRRGQNNLTVFSIMIPVTLTAVLFAINFKEQLGKIAGLNLAGFIPLLCFAYSIYFYVEFYTSKRINKISFERIDALERELNIEGNRFVYDRLMNDPTEHKAYFIRTRIRHVGSLLFMVLYVLMTLYLFL